MDVLVVGLAGLLWLLTWGLVRGCAAMQVSGAKS